jgi:hypothetical protein
MDPVEDVSTLTRKKLSATAGQTVAYSGNGGLFHARNFPVAL